MPLSKQIRVKYLQRKKDRNAFSLERVFDTVRGALPPEIVAEEWDCRFQSRGIVRVLLNMFEAAFHQGVINHVTGDVYYIATLLARHKTVLTIHDCVSLQFSTGLRYARNLWLWYKLPVSRVGAITVISEFARNELLRYVHCDTSLLHVIPNPVSNAYIASPREFNSVHPVILQVGTSEHNKNLSRVAEALRGIPCTLEIIGPLSDRQRQVLESNSINFTQHSGLSDEQVVERYRNCDLVVFASLYEGFGLPIVEANATGRPVVTSNIAPMPEVAGRAACLVDPFDCSSIRAGITRIIEDAGYRDQLISAGFENVKRFRADVIAAQYAELYRVISARL